jgi:hypothetical protein
MKKIQTFLLLILMTAILQSVNAQVSIIYQLNDEYSFFDTERLYQFSVFNSMDRQMEVIIRANLYDSGGKRILSAKTGEVVLSAHSFSPAHEFFNSSIVFNNVKVQDYYHMNGSLPPGKYSLCVEINSNAGNGERELAKACINLSISSIMKIQLISPADGSILNDNEPLFNWTPLNLNQGYYNLNIYDNRNEKLKSMVIPYNQIKNLEDNYYKYEMEVKELNPGIEYEWEVIGYYNNEVIDKSEKWKFTIKDKSTKSGDYRLLQKQMNPSDYIQNNVIRFAYDNRYNESKLNYKLTNIKRNKGVTNIPEIVLSNTINKIEINLFSISGLSFNESYLLTIFNKFNEEFVLTFKIKSPDEE